MGNLAAGSSVAVALSDLSATTALKSELLAGAALLAASRASHGTMEEQVASSMRFPIACHGFVLDATATNVWQGPKF